MGRGMRGYDFSSLLNDVFKVCEFGTYLCSACKVCRNYAVLRKRSLMSSLTIIVACIT